MRILQIGILAALLFFFSACRTDLGITGGTLTTSDKSARLILPAGTFSSPVMLSLEKVTLPNPSPLEYTTLESGAFRLDSPKEFTANKNAILEVNADVLFPVGQNLGSRVKPSDAIMVALVSGPSRAKYQMLPMNLSNGSWQVQIQSQYLCQGCTINPVFLKPTRMEINAPDTLREGWSTTATVSFFNRFGASVVVYTNVTWQATGDAATISATGLISARQPGQSTISARAGNATNLLTASKVITVTSGIPVIFAANYYGTIKGYSWGQFSLGGLQTPTVTLTLPTGTYPNDLKFDANNNLWVTDYANHRLLRFSTAQLLTTGNPIPDVIIAATFVEAMGGDSLYKPVALAFDMSGNLWVTNELNHVVRYNASSLAVSGSPLPDRVITNGIAHPMGVGLDRTNNLWVANYAGDNIVVYSPLEQETNSMPSRVYDAVTKPIGLVADNVYLSTPEAIVSQQFGLTWFDGLAANGSIPNSAFATTALASIAPYTRFFGSIPSTYLMMNDQANGSLIGFAGPANPSNRVLQQATEPNIGFGGIAVLDSGLSNNLLPTIRRFSATPNTLGVAGGQVTLSWDVPSSNSTLSIDQGVGVVTGSSITVPVTTTTTFTLTAYGDFGKTMHTVTVVVDSN